MTTRLSRRRFIQLGAALAGMGLGSLTAGIAESCTSEAQKEREASTRVKTLVLYDTKDPTYGFLGELYAMMAVNLSSHFGGWVAKPVADYTAGEMAPFTAVVYIGSIYNEPLPPGFLDDVLNAGTPVIWLYDNIWQLQARLSLTTGVDSAPRYGWKANAFDHSSVKQVNYKGRTLTRSAGTLTEPAAPLIATTVTEPGKAIVLASAARSDGILLPWAIRSGNLTYVAEIPFVGISESDRVLIFCDLLFDALAPATRTRHRALVRLEDIGPDSDPAHLMAIASYLKQRHIPFGFGVYPRYRDPLGVRHTPGTQYTLASRPLVVKAINYLLDNGGTMIMHGWTHQYGDERNPHVRNPYSGQSGDDAEFYYAYIEARGEGSSPTDSGMLQNTVEWQGPVAEDALTWASARLESSGADFAAAHLPEPRIFEFPHYFASVTDYRAVAARFSVRYERAIYPSGLLSKGKPDYSHLARQFFPYTVRDLYGTSVIPENLGNYVPGSQKGFVPRYPWQIASNAEKNLVIRDGLASFFYHPYYGVDPLKLIIEGGVDETGTAFTGLLDLGYTFVSPAAL